MHEGISFLKSKYNTLHTEEVVVDAARRTEKRTGERVPQKPEYRIQNYLERFSQIAECSDKEIRDIKLRALKHVLHDAYVINENSVPESYFASLELNEGEQGSSGRLSEVERIKRTQVVQEDQQESLDRWVDYFVSPDSVTLPAWAKYWAFRSMLSMSGYDKKERAFGKRTKGTIAPFPNLDPEALSYVLDTITSRVRGEQVKNPVQPGVNTQAVEDKRVTDEEFERIIETESFAKYYAFAVEHVAHNNSEHFPETRGEWRYFATGSDPAELTKTLQGQGTGWCTAGTATAAGQLVAGDFHIYYSLNKLGVPTIPRVAIYRKNGHIEQVRGVVHKQNLDPYILPVVQEKLTDFGEEGEKYQKAFTDMASLADIHAKHNAGEALTPEELRFLYQLDSNITGFGHEDDPRVNELISSRDYKKDIEAMFGVTEPNECVAIFLESKTLQGGNAQAFLMQLEHLNQHSLELLLNNGYAWFVCENISRKFDSPDYVKVAAELLKKGDEELAGGKEYTHYYRILVENLPNFNRLDHSRLIEQLLKREEESVVLEYLHHFQNINHITLVEQVLKLKFGGLWLATYLSNLHGVNHTYIMRRLLERDELHLVAECLPNFKGVNHVRLAKLLIDRGEGYWLERNLGHFKGLGPDIVTAARHGTDLAGIRFEKVKQKTLKLIDDMYWRLYK